MSPFDVFTGPRPDPDISFYPEHAIGIVNLALLTNTPLMLPLALYWYCYLGGELLDGWTREDSTIEYLSPEDVKCCVDAHITLTCQEYFLISRLFGTIPQERYKDRGKCTTAVTQLACGAIREHPNTNFHALVEWSEVLKELDLMCEGCVQVLCEQDKAEHRRIWEALPQILGITVERRGKPGGGEGTGNVV